MKIKSIFRIHYGSKAYHSKGWLKDKIGSTPLISSKATDRGVYGKFDIPADYSHILTIPSTGSVGYSLYQNLPCAVDDNTLVMEPTIELSEKEMIYYSIVIREHSKRFMYGRQVTPERLGELEIPSPDEIPSWVYTMEIPSFDDIAESKIQDKVELPPVKQWKTYTYDNLFKIQKVTGPKISEIKKTIGNTPYVSATAENNGIAYYGDFETTTKGNCLTVGHLGDCFYQSQDFAGSNVTVLIPKFELTKELGMFLSTLINTNKYKYCYGRVIGISRLKEETISLPVTEQGEPDWDLMKRYINSLPYSKYL